MSYDPSDAAYDQFVDELYKEFRDSALEDDQLYNRVVDDFKESRLRDYYSDHPLVAEHHRLARAATLRSAAEGSAGARAARRTCCILPIVACGSPSTGERSMDTSPPVAYRRPSGPVS